MNKKRSAFAITVAASLVLAACGSDDDDDTAASTPPVTITVGAAGFPESQLLAEIYAEALENNNVRVARKDPIQSRELYYQAILNNEIQLVPEYTNSLLSYVVKQADPSASPTAKNVAEQITALKAALPATLTIGAPSTAEDKDVIVCSAAVAEQYSLTNLTSLGAASANITIGAPPEFETRSPFGLVGFKELFGADFKEFVPLDFGVIADSIKSGAIDCGNLFSTMSVITTEGFVALDDDTVVVPNEAVLPLMRTEVANAGVLSIVDKVSAGLTTEKLKALMVKIEVDKKAPTEVAKEYLATLTEG